jgi:protein-S-isoprenylcysteine O-methyltransferase Ste14
MIFLRLIVPAAMVALVLFGSAGRADLWNFWAYAGVVFASVGTVFTLLARFSPALFAERVKPPADRDRATRRLVAAPLLAHLIVAGLDARFGWTAMPLALVIAGLVAMAGAFALVGWTLLSNPFASSAVRLQTDRKQTVISNGPYAFVRHPMYLAVFVCCVSAGPALGSWYAGACLAPVLVVFVRRTLLEERMLRAELDGYAEYAARVRWRVVPGVF